MKRTPQPSVAYGPDGDALSAHFQHVKIMVKAAKAKAVQRTREAIEANPISDLALFDVMGVNVATVFEIEERLHKSFNAASLTLARYMDDKE